MIFATFAFFGFYAFIFVFFSIGLGPRKTFRVMFRGERS